MIEMERLVVDMDRASLVLNLAREHRESASSVVKGAIEKVMREIASPMVVARVFDEPPSPTMLPGEVWKKGA